VSHEAQGRSPLNFVAGAGREFIGRGNQIRNILSVVPTPNLAVAGAKLGYRYLSGLAAMSADGFHALLDGFANVVGVIGIVVAARPPDREHQFGHERYETLASMAIGALLAVGVIEIVQPAIGRWQSRETPQVTRLSFGVMLGTKAINAGVMIRERPAVADLHCDLLEADAPQRIRPDRLGGLQPGTDWRANRSAGRRRRGLAGSRYGGVGALGNLARGIACAN
jgi:hypothetical protein